MGALALVAVAVVAILALAGPKGRGTPSAKFDVGDTVQLKVGSEGKVLTVLDRALRTGGWHYEVTALGDGFNLPAPGENRATWWTHESSLAHA